MEFSSFTKTCRPIRIVLFVYLIGLLIGFWASVCRGHVMRQSASTPASPSRATLRKTVARLSATLEPRGRKCRIPITSLNTTNRVLSSSVATMATELTVQSERAFQKQPHIFQNSKAKTTKKRVGKGGRRWYKDVGLGFRTPKTAIEGTYIGTLNRDSGLFCRLFWPSSGHAILQDTDP